MKETSSEKVMVFIDGSNFYHGLKTTVGIASLDFSRLVQHLTGPSRRLIRTYYYNAPVSQSEGKERYKGQQRFFAALRKTQGFEVRLGRLEKHRTKVSRASLVGDLGEECADKFVQAFGESFETYAEKGVDVQIAVDMLQLGFNKAYDTAILVSGDADFVSVIQAVKELGRRVEVAYVTGRPAYHLQQVCDAFIKLDADALRPLLLKSGN